MQRRDFINAIAGAIAGLPCLARAQTGSTVIGFLHAGAREESASRVASFLRGLSETGYYEARNVTIDYRWAKGNYDLLPKMAAELLHEHVSVLAALTTPAALAAKVATATTPIVFTTGGDPVKLRLVATFDHPGRNITGATLLSRLLVAKQVELLNELAPQAAVMGFLLNPKDANSDFSTHDAQVAADKLSHRLVVLKASTDEEIDLAFATALAQHVSALIVDGDSFFFSRREHLVAQVKNHSIPAVYAYRQYVEAGGLLSYSPNLEDAYRQAGIYAGRILNGEKPSDLPVVQPTKFDLIINLKSAKALGISVPLTLQVAADEVIE